MRLIPATGKGKLEDPNFKSFFGYTGSMTQHLSLACRKCLRPRPAMH